MLQYKGMDLLPPRIFQMLVERGEARGKARGRHAGKVEAGRSVLLKVATHTGIVLTTEQRERIDRCDDPDTLDRWFDRALAARTAEELFD